jgi:hypothetical protein
MQLNANVENDAPHAMSAGDTRAPYLRPTVEELDVAATRGKPAPTVAESTTPIGS